MLNSGLKTLTTFKHFLMRYHALTLEILKNLFKSKLSINKIFLESILLSKVRMCYLTLNSFLSNF